MKNFTSKSGSQASSSYDVQGSSGISSHFLSSYLLKRFAPKALVISIKGDVLWHGNQAMDMLCLPKCAQHIIECTDQLLFDWLIHRMEAIKSGREDNHCYQTVMVKKEDQSYKVDILIEPIRDAAGNINSFVIETFCTEMNDAEAVSLNEKMIRDLQNKIEYLDMFVVGGSHDMRNQLGVATSFVKLYSRFTNTAKREMAIEEISASLKSTLNILEGFTELTRQKKCFEKEKEHCNFSLTLLSVKDRLKARINATDATIEFDFSECPGVEYIPTLMDSILYNLTSNSLKYRHPGRPTLIKIGTTRLDDGHIELSVKDNGIGIDMERDGHLIFRPFERLGRTIPGRGLGLSFIQQVVRRNGGDIKVESQPGVGSTFKVILKDQQVV